MRSRQLKKFLRYIKNFLGINVIESFRIDVGLYIPGGALDYIELEPEGILRVVGWSGAIEELLNQNQVFLEPVVSGGMRYPDAAYRMIRNDLKPDLVLSGFMLEFIGGFVSGEAVRLRLADVSYEIGQTECLALHNPHYRFLLSSSKEVVHRNGIYGSGNPSLEVSPEVLALAKNLPPPILDFGCGAGALVKQLRNLGLEATGLEIDRPAIRENVIPEIREYIQLYDGAFPLNFASNSFNSVVASEVIEHIPLYEDAMREIFRISASKVLITVPDMAAVPILHKYSVVPWHILESTHVNFFTVHSLTEILRSYCRENGISVFRIGNFVVNGTYVPGALAALCEIDEMR